MLKQVWNFISGKGASVISDIESTVDEYVFTKEEKFKSKEEAEQFKAEMKLKLAELNKKFYDSEAGFKLELEKLISERDKLKEETFRKRLELSGDVIKAELSQDDKYTKRARPTVVYAGLVFVFLELVGLRVFVLDLLEASPAIVESSSNVFNSFMWVWGGVVGVYAAGRSAEKRGVSNKVTDMATGSGKSRIKDAIQDLEDYKWSK